MSLSRDASMGPPPINEAEAHPDSGGTAPTPLESLPSVDIHIPADLVPENISAGLQEIARNHIRPNAIRITDRGPVPAGGSTGRPSTSWCWNLVFIPDEALDEKSWSCSTSSSCFAPVYGKSQFTDGSVPELFIISVRYHPDRPCNAFRGLGHVLATTRCIATASQPRSELHRNLYAPHSSPWHLCPSLAHERLNISETANFTTLGTMIDCSRNGVLNVASVKFLLRVLACLGYNMLQLYTEDTYTIEGEPFFGYLRGPYTQGDLREIDDYAYNLGIEVIPCIQTLGHLGQMLQWPRYLALRDTAEVLLSEWPETYVMLEKMIRAATSPFRSKKIHLGMDETHGLSHGRYYSIFGHANGKDGSRVFVEHLQRVDALCRKMGLQPMIWSDMIFCLSARNNSLTGYYDSGQPEAAKVDGIPDGIDLVFWSYYFTSQESYAKRIASHRELRGAPPWTAAGSWTWSRFWTALPFTFTTCRANMNASKAAGSGVDHVFLTIWGDEGNEVDLWSSLPAWVYYADHGFTRNEEVDVALTKAKFDGIVGGNFDDFVLASKLDEHSREDKEQTVDDRIHFAPNTSKWMLWSDPVASFVEPSAVASGVDLESHYAWLEGEMRERIDGIVVEVEDDDDDEGDKGAEAARMRDDDDDDHDNSARRAASLTSRTLAAHPLNRRLMLPLLLARCLALKANLRRRLHRAYVQQDWANLRALTERTRRCAAAARKLWLYHRSVWMSLYHPEGWEVLELRYGGLVARLQTLHARLLAFLCHVDAGGAVGVALSRVEGGVWFDTSFVEEDADETSAQSELQTVDALPELETELHIVYGSPDQLLDYHRVSRPTYC